MGLAQFKTNFVFVLRDREGGINERSFAAHRGIIFSQRDTICGHKGREMMGIGVDTRLYR